MTKEEFKDLNIGDVVSVKSSPSFNSKVKLRIITKEGFLYSESYTAKIIESSEDKFPVGLPWKMKDPKQYELSYEGTRSRVDLLEFDD